jgi:predicted RNA binding protein YcfA (HicA-like mRNA interferase family)
LPDLPVVRSSECVRALERAGFERVRQKGSHLFMEHGVSGATTTLPIHGGDIKPRLLRKIITAAGLTPDEFLQFL